MSSTQKHIIQSERIELTKTGRENASRWQLQSASLVHEKIQPAIEKLFSSLAQPDEHLVIEKIDLDLGTVSEDNLLPELERRLTEAIQQASRTLRMHNTDQYFSGDGWSGPQPGVQLGVDVGGTLISAGERAGEAFLFFLEHGRLPFWWSTADASSADTISAVDVLQASLQLNLALIAVLKRSSNARLRLVSQVTDVELDALCTSSLEMQGLLEGWHWLRTVLLNWLDGYQGKPSIRRIASIRTSYWLTWIEYLIGHQPSVPNLVAVTKKAFGNAAEANQFAKAVGASIAAGLQDATTEFAEGAKIVRLMLESQKPDASLLSDELPTKHKAVESEIADDSNLIDAKANKASVEPFLHEIEQKEETAREDMHDPSVFVSSAGIVLLHPFLPELFRSLELWAGGETFVSSAAHERAVCLLGYLATGLPANEEHQLVLAKTLCKYPWKRPVASKEPLTPREREACDALLDAVIGHWKALRNTSPEGLRQAFFTRDGKLVQEENSWQLTIERKAQDVLLDALPWGCSLIKLPWMPKLVKVSWI